MGIPYDRVIGTTPELGPPRRPAPSGIPLLPQRTVGSTRSVCQVLAVRPSADLPCPVHSRVRDPSADQCHSAGPVPPSCVLNTTTVCSKAGVRARGPLPAGVRCPRRCRPLANQPTTPQTQRNTRKTYSSATRHRPLEGGRWRPGPHPWVHQAGVPPGPEGSVAGRLRRAWLQKPPRVLPSPVDPPHTRIDPRGTSRHRWSARRVLRLRPVHPKVPARRLRLTNPRTRKIRRSPSPQIRRVPRVPWCHDRSGGHRPAAPCEQGPPPVGCTLARMPKSSRVTARPCRTWTLTGRSARRRNDSSKVQQSRRPEGRRWPVEVSPCAPPKRPA